MKKLVLRRWFLLLLLAGLLVVWLYPQGLRPVTAHLEPRALVALALFLMAWGLQSRHLLRSLLRPLPALWAVLLSYGLLPALAYLFGWLLADADLRIGLLIMASVPCTLASAVIWTRLAGGNEATALLVVVLTTALSWLATTAWLVLATGTSTSIRTTDLMGGLLLVLLLPVGLGQLVRVFAPLAQAAVRFKPFLSVVSQVLILSIILKAAVEVRDQLTEKASLPGLSAFLATAAACLGTHLAALLCGWWSSQGLRFERPQRIAVAFACSQKSLPVALYVFAGYFQPASPLAVVPLVFYHVGQLIVDTLIADSMAHRASPMPQAGVPQ
jgi:sodium/bile acid cotransporter 7